MQPLFNVSCSGTAIVFTVLPVEGSDRTASVVVGFSESDFKEHTSEEIAKVIAARLKNAFGILERYVTFTATKKDA